MEWRCRREKSYFPVVIEYPARAFGATEEWVALEYFKNYWNLAETKKQYLFYFFSTYDQGLEQTKKKNHKN